MQIFKVLASCVDITGAGSGLAGNDHRSPENFVPAQTQQTNQFFKSVG